MMPVCGEAEEVGYAIVWGASDNARSFWRNDARDRLGRAPCDSADAHAEKLPGVVTDSATAQQHQGGVDTSRG